MSITADRVSLSDRDAELLAQASRLMGEALDRSRARRIALVDERDDGGDIVRLEVPPATLRLLSQILALMARQQTFVLYPESSELTTKQAAEVLGVSRPFLIRVLEAGQIPFRKVGRHRRVPAPHCNVPPPRDRSVRKRRRPGRSWRRTRSARPRAR